MCRIPAIALSSLLALSMILPGATRAAELKPGLSPEDVLREAYARMRSGDWVAAAETFDPAALARFRTMLEPLFKAADAPAEAGAEGEGSRDAMMLMMLFAPAKSVEEVRALSDRELFARLMRGTMSLAGAKLNEQKVLGSVAEGKDTVHVVTRNTAQVDAVTFSKVEAVTLQRTPQGWRLALTGEIEGLAESLQATGEAAKASSDGAGEAPPAP